MASTDALIIGGGLIGCAIAWELRKAGLAVTVVERQHPGEEASTAAAGMLAPSAEIVHGPDLLPLAQASNEIYPAFITEIEAASGLTVEHRREGTLLVALCDAEARRLEQWAEVAVQKGLQAVVLNPQLARQREPNLSESVQKAVYLASDTQLDTRRLMHAVLLAAVRQGVEIRTGVTVTAAACEAGRVVGVETTEGRLSAGVVVNAAGSWAGSIAGCERYAPTRPIRGQIVQVRHSPAAIRHVLRSEAGYLVPRAHGRILAGSTMEDVGYDRRVTTAGVRRLLEVAQELVPSLAEAQFEEAWAGLRPDTPDHKPILGPTDVNGLFIATGHFRNGILLAPITARLMKELIVDGRASLDLAEFSPMRFASNP